jgi:hypothetical protein
MVWWEIVFMLVILKIPVVYLCAVVWWAIKAEPEPEGGSSADDPEPRPWWRPPRGRRRLGPHGSPARRPARAAAARGKVAA